jgi:hypothetical protein
MVVEDHQGREPSMSKITTIGLDLAKNVFQIYAVDETDGLVVTGAAAFTSLVTRCDAALQGGQGRSLANSLTCAETSLGRRRSLGEQDRTHRLGNHAQTGYLPMRGSSGMTCRAAA